jgi:hypothetical protein
MWRNRSKGDGRMNEGEIKRMGVDYPLVIPKTASCLVKGRQSVTRFFNACYRLA